MNKTLIVVQARLGSSRLPNKALLPILERPLLSYTFERLKAIKLPCEIVLATTDKPEDNKLESLAKAYGLFTFRGSEQNVLERIYLTALNFEPEVIVRITGDCPLVQPSLLERMLSFFYQNNFDYVSNVLERSYPKGMDLEVFSFKAFQRVYKQAKTLYQIEHVTPYFYQNLELFSLYNFKHTDDLSFLNVSVDTQKDFEYVQKIITSCYPQNPLFELKESLRTMLKLHKIKVTL